MRNAINNNPIVQFGLIGVLALIVGFMVLTRLGGPPEDEVPPGVDPKTGAAIDGSAAAAAPATTAPSTSGTATEAPSTTVPGTSATGTAAAPTAPAVGASQGFVAGPGLPAEVVKAYAEGKVVALLVVRGAGIDDRVVKGWVEELRSRGDTAVFITKAADIADYSRITQGVQVERVPALVTLQPRDLAEGPLPQASIRYGLRSKASLNQAIENALYTGPRDLPYYPN